ncbi:MAG: GNAT family N-acetyltransferase [Chitinophagaceae bacterium]
MSITEHQITIRPIKQSDNKELSNIIKNTLREFGADRPGTVAHDPTTDTLFELFRQQGSVYYVAEKDNKLVGGGGIFPTPGLPRHTCELVKMYLIKEARGLGLGRQLIQQSIDFAKEAGYEYVYLETMPELKKALATYAKFGFKYLDAPLGNTGHFGCELWMKLKL